MLGEDEEGACRVREVEYEFQKKKKRFVSHGPKFESRTKRIIESEK